MSSITVEFNTPSVEWVVNHGMNKSVVSDVFTYDEDDNLSKILPSSVIEESQTQIKVIFTSPKRGLVRLT